MVVRSVAGNNGSAGLSAANPPATGLSEKPLLFHEVEKAERFTATSFLTGPSLMRIAAYRIAAGSEQYRCLTKRKWLRSSYCASPQ